MPNTPNMNLLLPTVSITPGPTWAAEVNAAFDTVDSHNHTTGQGVQVPSAGIGINEALSFNQFDATMLRSSRMVNQSSPLSNPDDLTCLYVSGGNLFYNNAAGQAVQITLGAGLDASSVGGFGGDYGMSTATAFYTSATTTFTYWSNTNVSAFTDTGKVTIHPTTSSTLGVSLVAPTSFSSGSYNLTFPSGLPASKKILTVDASGNIDDSYDVDGSTIVVSSNTLQVPSAGITSSQLASNSVTTSKITDANVTFPKIQASNFATSSLINTVVNGPTAETDITGLAATITSTGRMVAISLEVTTSSLMQTGTATSTVTLFLERNGTNIAAWGIPASAVTFTVDGVAQYNVIDFAVYGTASVLSYKWRVSISGGATFGVQNLRTVVREVL